MVSETDVVAFGAHPDDVELGCGGTVARLAAAGLRVAIADLTAGELGTRGDRATRRREAEAAASLLGVERRECLRLPDGGLSPCDPQQVAAVVREIRRRRPRAVLVPDRDDPHPDHRAAAGLLERAVFLSGVRAARPEAGEAWRPRLVLAYPGPRQLLEPSVVVDVSAVYGRKRDAILAHASQFDPARGVRTHLASGYFTAAIEGRDRAAGNTVGVEFGEGFRAPGPLAADELSWLLGGRGMDPELRTADRGSNPREAR
jgi:bacillithiol biosynthesis deacetylase BshB1